MIVPLPVYLLSGGCWDNFEIILRTIFTQAGIKKPCVAYSGVANGERKDFYGWARESLRAAGACDVIHIEVAHKGWQELCHNCDIFFVSGGDVAKGMEVLRQANAVQELRCMYSAGKIFIGVSAGSIMLAKKWIVWPNVNNDDAVELVPCIGLANILCDTHDEPNWSELRTLSSRCPGNRPVIGLRSGSAIAVSGTRFNLIAGKIDIIKGVRPRN